MHFCLCSFILCKLLITFLYWEKLGRYRELLNGCASSLIMFDLLSLKKVMVYQKILFNVGVGKLSSERHVPLWKAFSCSRSRRFSCVTFKGDYDILAVRNYGMQTEKRYSYLITVKFLPPAWSLKKSKHSLEM